MVMMDPRLTQGAPRVRPDDTAAALLPRLPAQLGGSA